MTGIPRGGASELSLDKGGVCELEKSHERRRRHKQEVKEYEDKW